MELKVSLLEGNKVFQKKIKFQKNKLFLENQVIWGNQVTLGLFLKSRDTVFKRRNFFLMPIEFL